MEHWKNSNPNPELCPPFLTIHLENNSMSNMASNLINN